MNRIKRKRHRNPRGLFLGAMLGGVAGYFLGRVLGSGAITVILGALAGAALLYRVDPGPWNRP
jgi:outer membrane lipoprotein SlyB